jgi:DNA mismatch repair ATPase MutS
MAYTNPKVAEKGAGNLKFLEARHPFLEGQDDLIYMANDIQTDKGSCILDFERDCDSRTHRRIWVPDYQ